MSDEIGSENFVKEKVDRETAEKEFGRFVASWDIDANTDAMSGEDRESFEQQKTRIVSKIIDGHATIDDAGDITYSLTQPLKDIGSLVFKVPSGVAYMKMDQHKDRQNVHKMFSFLGEMTRQNPKMFSIMDARDTKFCMGVATLFLAS